MSFQFEENGTYEGNDGSMILRQQFRVTETAKGFILHFSYLSDNNQLNCQGLSAEFVRRNSLKVALVQFTNAPIKMRLYFGDTEKAPVMTLIRRAAQPDAPTDRSQASGR